MSVARKHHFFGTSLGEARNAVGNKVNVVVLVPVVQVTAGYWIRIKTKVDNLTHNAAAARYLERSL